mgnify:CR=1 FL=1
MLKNNPKRTQPVCSKTVQLLTVKRSPFSVVALNRKLLGIGSSKYIFTTGERELALGVAAWETRLDVDTVSYGDCLNKHRKKCGI